MSRIPVCIALLGIVGCGGACPGAESASSETTVTAPPESASPAGAPEESSASAESPAENAAPASKSQEPAGDVQFPEGASVADAVAAVPRGTQRANIDAETLAEPLQSEAMWAPCKVGAQHFKVKVAVWNGRAVGVDVTTPSKPLGSCVEKQVRGIDWRDKVKSLNTVEYSM